ncbi:MAG: RecB family exonuclease [Nitriliruptoraceae bacterium]
MADERDAHDGDGPSGAAAADGGQDGPPVEDGAGGLRLIDVDGAPPGTFGQLEPTTPALLDRYGRVRLSFSRVDAYQNCPRRFRYAYIDRLPREPSPHLSFGSSIHGALEAFYDRKLPGCPSEEELLGFLYDAWDSSGFAELPREEQLSWYRHAQDVLRRFHRREAPRYRLPAATEAWFDLPIEHQAVVVGSIDRVDADDEGALHLVDYKTNRKVQDRGRVAGSLQLSIYALACQHLYGQLPATVTLDFVVPGVPVTAQLDELDLDRARRTVLETAEAVRAGSFAPTPNRLCEWCDYRAICPAWTGEGPQVLGPAVEHAEQLRRRLTREIRELRELETGIQRTSDELDVED